VPSLVHDAESVLPFAALLPLGQGLDVVLDGLLNYSLPVTVVDQETVTREGAELRVQRLEFPKFPKFPVPYLPRNRAKSGRECNRRIFNFSIEASKKGCRSSPLLLLDGFRAIC
jgi:hypothetical protein